MKLAGLWTAAGRLVAFARPGNWFVSKIPPLLAVAYLEILRSGVAPDEAAQLLGWGFYSIVCVAVYGHVINDMFDLEADRLANKVNQLAAIPLSRRVLLAVGFLTGGFLPGWVVGYPASAWWLLALNYLWPTLYSVPVVRLKERGVLGVACDALGSHITPTLLVLALFSGATGQFGLLAWPPVLWAGCLGLKGILHHQIGDRENDIQSGLVTFATRTPVESLQRFLTRFNLLVELPVSAVLVAAVMPWCPAAVAALALYLATETAKYQLGFQFALSADPATIRASVPFTNEMFYVLWMPMAAAVQLSLDNPAFAWLPLVHLLVFYPPVAQQIADWRALIGNLTILYRGRRAARPAK